jgi:hypothetical protein
VMAELGLTLGEVSITGFSLGGLMSVYASGARPTQFKRAYAQSPSVWWNNGDMSGVITSTYATNGGILPTAVVMQMGTAEGYSYIEEVIPPTIWNDIMIDVMNSWLEVGMGANGLKNSNDHYKSHNANYYTLNSNLVVFNNIGGVHTATSWGDTFTYGLMAMYAPDFPAPYTKQRNSNYKMLYPGVPIDDDHCGDDDDEKEGLKRNVEGLAAGLAVVVVFSAAAIYYLYTKNARFKPTLGPPRRSPNLNNQPSSNA